jgi:hypothetical protein
MLLDLVTIFFIVAGCALLWLNLRPKAPRSAITKTDGRHLSASTEHLPAKPHPLLENFNATYPRPIEATQSHASTRQHHGCRYGSAVKVESEGDELSHPACPEDGPDPPRLQAGLLCWAPVVAVP